MTSSLLLGAGVGLGLWAVLVWAAPPRPALSRVIARLRDDAEHEPFTPHYTATDGAGESSGWLRLARPIVPMLRAAGLPTAALRRDLDVTGTDPDVYLTRKAFYAITGLIAPAVVVLGRALLGRPAALQAPVLAAVVLAAAGFLFPDIQIRAEAARRRRDFTHALSAYLDLVVISLAGGAGIDSALHDAATIGRGWAFAHLNRAIDTARLTRTSAWTALRRLGDQLGIRELSELAAATSLAGTEGAKVRASLTARAESLRTHLLTDAEKQAKAATQRLVLPWTLLFLGFLIFLGYPAVHQFTETFHK